MSEEVRFDLRREARIGFTEAVFCRGKTPEQLAQVLRQFQDSGKRLLLTRLDRAGFEALDPEWRRAIDYDPGSRTAIYGPWSAPAGEPRVAIVTAGTSDLPVAREAARTLAFYGEASREIADVGVAGLWRILDQQETLRGVPVVIVAAGMDGALFSVLGGLVGGVLIAVPVSTGYGAARGGRTALDSALTSCAPGVVAVNIDNGYGGACAALRALRAIDGNTKMGSYQDGVRS